MNQSTRIVLNTLATFSHNLFALIAALFSARWVLQALGQSDFGLYGVIGSIILLISFLNGGLTVGVARYYAHSIGRGHNMTEENAVDDLKHWFNTAFSIHLFLPFIIIIIGLPLGEYAIKNWLTIPADRVLACLWVFRITLATAFMNVFSVPFTSMYTGHQLITELAIFGIIKSFLMLTFSWFLLQVENDRLIVYSLYLMAINAGVPVIQIIRALIKFKACRVKFSYMYQRKYMKELFSFVGWKTFGMSCVVIRDQGTPVLVNLYHGPIVNAAYSIANRLSSQAASLSTAMMGAIQPALTTSEGKGDRQKMISMSLQACKFATLLILFFIIPLFIEMETILKLWLKTPPDYTSELCKWILVILVIDKITTGAMMAVNAYGKIAAYEIVQGSLILLSIPLIWLFFRLGYGPVTLAYALFTSTVLYCSGRLVFSKYLMKFPIKKWFIIVALPISFIIITSFTTGYLIRLLFEPGLLRILLTSFITTIATAGIGWYRLMNANERKLVAKMTRNAYIKLTNFK